MDITQDELVEEAKVLAVENRILTRRLAAAEALNGSLSAELERLRADAAEDRSEAPSEALEAVPAA